MSIEDTIKSKLTDIERKENFKIIAIYTNAYNY